MDFSRLASRLRTMRTEEPNPGMESAEALVADYGHWVMDFVLQSTLCSECNKRQTVPNLVLRIPEGWDAGDAPATMDALARYLKRPPGRPSWTLCGWMRCFRCCIHSGRAMSGELCCTLKWWDWWRSMCPTSLAQPVTLGTLEWPARRQPPSWHGVCFVSQRQLRCWKQRVPR